VLAPLGASGRAGIAIPVGSADVAITVSAANVAITVGAADIAIPIGTSDVAIPIGATNITITIGTADIAITIGAANIAITIGIPIGIAIRVAGIGPRRVAGIRSHVAHIRPSVAGIGNRLANVRSGFTGVRNVVARIWRRGATVWRVILGTLRLRGWLALVGSGPRWRSLVALCIPRRGGVARWRSVFLGSGRLRRRGLL
jgi:hypothetical protein